MTGSQLDAPRIDAVLDAVCRTLSGDFLLVGGALVSIWLDRNRVTEDLDLVGISREDSRIVLMDLALAHGLPVDAINSAADFFVMRIEGWHDEIEILREGPAARIYRPTPTLFLLLKCSRLSEQDLADCLLLLDRVRSEGLALDRARVLAAIEDREDDVRAGRVERARRLREAVAA
jgi:hypothetical protein